MRYFELTANIRYVPRHNGGYGVYTKAFDLWENVYWEYSHWAECIPANTIGHWHES